MDNNNSKVIDYSIAKGDKKGRYTLTVKSFKAYHED
jgi:hypothetical protein